MKRTVFNIGFDSGGKHKKFIRRRSTKAHRVWSAMLTRCYYAPFQEKQPTYKNCSVVDEWHDFQVFTDWFEANYVEGYHLDKDLLVPGNNVYGPETCCFVPQAINSLLLDNGVNRGEYLIGVSIMKSTGKYYSRLKINGETKRLGQFDTELEAHMAYKEAKEAHVKDMAEAYQDKIPTGVYEALMEWELIEEVTK